MARTALAATCWCRTRSAACSFGLCRRAWSNPTSGRWRKNRRSMRSSRDCTTSHARQEYNNHHAMLTAMGWWVRVEVGRKPGAVAAKAEWGGAGCRRHGRTLL
jgi:hypothetical protein